MGNLHDPVLGPLTRDEEFGWYHSEPKPIRFLANQLCSFVLERYDSDPDPGGLRRAVQNALEASPDILTAVQPYVVQYCEERLAHYPEFSRPTVRLERPSDVWSHVQFGDEIQVIRRDDGDAEDGLCLSLECSCAWEREHGLQLVLRDGRVITKVGPFDGHLTNADAYADPNLVGVVYVPILR
jgi:hypothetical protein